MFGLDAPKITRAQFNGSDPQLQLQQRYAASLKSPATSAISSARVSLDDDASSISSSDEKKAIPSTSNSTEKKQKKRISLFRAANMVLSLK